MSQLKLHNSQDFDAGVTVLYIQSVADAVVPFGAVSCAEMTCTIFPSTRLDNPCIDRLVIGKTVPESALFE